MMDSSLAALTGLLTAPYRRGGETLEIPLGNEVGGWTMIPAYEFTEYLARYQAQPLAPRYVLYFKDPQTDIGRDGLVLEFEYSWGGVTRTTTVPIPARTVAGTSFAIPLEADADATLRLQRFRQSPFPLPGNAKDQWGITALLGNIAKISWVLGWEKDQIRLHLREVKRQRHRPSAQGASLDNLGTDLRVPRFPPREHSCDPDTVALYHLNEAVPDNGPVFDETNRFGLVGHPGVNKGAKSRAPGKFDCGFQFPADPKKPGSIEIPNDPDFQIPANGSFTVEAFVKTEDSSDPNPRVVIMMGQLDPQGALTAAGWSLTLGPFNEIPNNVGWAASDGVNAFQIFGALNLADDRFHHLAGLIDRDAKRARLLVDGEERASVLIEPLGGLINNDKILLGRSPVAHQFYGVIDEVRLSRVARSDFHPVLGESDAAYCQRLGIFEHWLLPTPAALVNAINSLVQIEGQPASFILIEKDRPAVYGSRGVRILPAELKPGQSLDIQGNWRAKEAEVSGLPQDEPDFNEIYLVRHDDPQVNYGGQENHHLMQAVTQKALDTLLDLLKSWIKKLIIYKSYDPQGAGLHRVGRALLLGHESLKLEILGAMAHQAGFDFVRHQGGQIYASVGPWEKLSIVIEPRAPAATPPPGIDVFVGQEISLSLEQSPLPRTGEFRWTLIPSGTGRAHWKTYPADPATLKTPATSRPHLNLAADEPGELIIRVEYTFKSYIVTGTLPILIGLKQLADKEHITADGDRQSSESAAVGPGDEPFNQIYLIKHQAAGVKYGIDPNNHSMQLVLEKPLNRLLEIIPAWNFAVNHLEILKAFSPGGPGLHKVGRALRLRHQPMTAKLLGALAHQAGFGYVERQGNEIYCSVTAGEKLEIVQAQNSAPLPDELFVGSPLEIMARPSGLPIDPLHKNLNWSWSSDRIGFGKGTFFNQVTKAKVGFTPQEPGLLLLNVTYLEIDPQATYPYSFEIRLKATLDRPEVYIPRHQYDLIMNILNYFHPIGIEVVTLNLREHVRDLLDPFPGYTYPDFRS